MKNKNFLWVWNLKILPHLGFHPLHQLCTLLGSAYEGLIICRIFYFPCSFQVLIRVFVYSY
jgi:hypothetical protein